MCAHVSARDARTKLRELLTVLSSPAGLRMFKRAYRENMLYKVRRYEELLARAEREVQDALEVVRIRVPDLKRAAGVVASDTTDNWHIFESISGAYQMAKAQASRFEAILNRARDRLTGTMALERVTSDDVAKEHREALVCALERMSTFAEQAHVVAHVVDMVAAFIKDPRLIRTRLMNFMLMGGAGTGKTTLAGAIGDVFARAGMFVGNDLIEAGRGELVGQYMGETVTKTRNFLVSHLDGGVVFIDEAYGITPWEDGKPESYGTEATTAMVEFMTRYPGLYCIITAGYEREMVRYFLPSNEGLDRRFPHKFVLNTPTAGNMVTIFKRQLLRAQGLPLPGTEEERLASEAYFHPDAFEYLQRLVEACTDGDTTYVEQFDSATRRSYRRVRTFTPAWDHMHRLFEHHAGSMTNLADEAVTVLYNTISFKDVVTVQRKRGRNARPHIRQQPVATMRNVVLQRIRSMALSDTDAVARQFEQVERAVLGT
jgi:SpoVK/Ycf46/Vps4 family AAA+-type ATPase